MKILIYVKILFGIVWLGICMYLGISMFMDNGTWVNTLFINQNVQTNKKFTGGEVEKEKVNNDYSIFIHEKVHDGVFKKSEKYFVQVDFLAQKSFPNLIKEELDIIDDSKPDIIVYINTIDNTVKFEALRNDIKGIMDKGSLAGIKTYVSSNEKDGLFEYKNKDMKGIVYPKGFSIRIMF